MYHHTKRGAKMLTERAKDYVSVVTAIVRSQIEKQQWEFQNDSTWYYADMIFYFPDKKTRDNHNTFKIMFDTLENHVFVNDYFVMPRVESVELDRDHPRVDLIIHNQTNHEREVAKERIRGVER